jgi:hypothetical protein
MAENGTANFASPDEYSAAIGAAKLDLFVTAGGEFKGRLTWLNLGGLHVLSVRLIMIAFDFKLLRVAA